MTQAERGRKHYEANREKMKANATAWRRNNPLRRKQIKEKHRLKKEYRLTPEQYNELRAAQDGKCGNSACSRPAEHFDHSHKSGEARGFLCFSCNISLGHLQDSVDMLLGLVSYLQHPPIEKV